MPPAAEVFQFDHGVYAIDESYPFYLLPPGVQKDIQAQTDDIELHFNIPAEMATYRMILVPHYELVRSLKERFGEEGYRKRVRSRETKALAKKIDEEGLQQPPVLDEGISRALALAWLGWDMPYFTIDEMMELEPPVYIPTLEGRHRK